MRLRPDETDLVGRWRMADGIVQPDPTSRRIERLVTKHLRHLGCDASGWDELYRDPDDGRLWELTYPESDVEGGGPPRLTCIPEDVARRKYGTAVDRARMVAPGQR